MRVFAAAAVSVSAAVMLSACGHGSKAGGNNAESDSLATTFLNPLFEKCGPDPWALYHDGNFYYMHTMKDSLVVWKTPDITAVKDAPHKTVWIPTDSTNMFNLWAPEIHFLDGKWYIYYAADDGNTDNHQLYVLENPNADPFEGEFTMKGRISTDPDNNWAIDGSVFEHNGELYMVWSGWQTRRVDDETQCIYIARMENPWTLGSERVLISKPELEWERQYVNPDGSTPDHRVFVNEGPQPLKDPEGKYVHVVYSASGCWTLHGTSLRLLSSPSRLKTEYTAQVTTASSCRPTARKTIFSITHATLRLTLKGQATPAPRACRNLNGKTAIRCSALRCPPHSVFRNPRAQ